GLPEVPDGGGAGAGRLRVDARDAPPPVRPHARGAGASAGRTRAAVLLPAGVDRRGRGPRSALSGERGARLARAVDPAYRAREATGGGVLPGPARSADDPAWLAGAVRAAAHPRRGAPHRGLVSPVAAREARAPFAARRHPRRRPDPQEGVAEALRVAHEAPCGVS